MNEFAKEILPVNIEDEIEEKRDHLIDALEKRMHQKTENFPLFTIRWSVI